MTDVKMVVPGAARGAMATKLLEAAQELELPSSVIRSQTQGFLVPEEVHQYLFPSEYPDDEQDPDDNDPDGDPDSDDSDDVTPTMAEGDQYDAMEFPELREAAKKRDLSAGGSAEEIKARLREADASPASE